MIALMIFMLISQTAARTNSSLNSLRTGNFVSGGNVDVTFNPSVKRESGKVESVLPLTGGKILVGGTFNRYNGTNRDQLARLNADGSLDQTFNVSVNGRVYAMAEQADGKVVIGGSFTQVGGMAFNRIARLNSDGSLDQTFNIGSGANSVVFDLEILGDGKILIGGAFTNFGGTTRRQLARLNTDGTLDTKFIPLNNTDLIGNVSTLDVQPDGKILIGGFIGVNRTPGTDIGLARLNADGSLDQSFQATLTGVEAQNDPTVNDFALLADGKILIGGNFTSVNFVPRDNIARLNTDGSVDQTFAAGVTNSVSFSYITGLDIQSDGKIVAGGFFSLPTANVARFNADGTVDATFDVGGGTDDSIEASAVLPDGKILVGGYFTEFDGTARNLFAQLNPDGTLDSSFDSGTGFSLLNSGFVYAAVIQPDGKILVGGDFSEVNGESRLSVVRLNPDGTLDETFDAGRGTLTTRNSVGRVLALELQPDGKILVGGSFESFDGTPASNLVRLNADGSRDDTFTGETDGGVLEFSVQTDGKILIGGDFQIVDGVGPYRGIARLNADGSLDTAFEVELISGSVREIVPLAGGKTLIGGSIRFTHPKTKTTERSIARINADGSFDPTFNSNIDIPLFLTVESIKILSDGKLLLGGSSTIARMVRLNPDGLIDEGFDFILTGNGSIIDMYVQPDGKTIAVGSFSVIQGEPLGYLARINEDGSLDLSWNIEASNRVDVMVPDKNGLLLVGGSFDNIGGIERHGLARLSVKQTTGKPIFDFDGDSKTDYSIFRPGPGEWWYLRSSDGGNRAFQFGQSSDTIVPADYTGDGKTDIAFWRESTGEWFILRSEDSSFYSFPFGSAGDIPAPGDFDGDGRADAAVFRPSTGTWFVLNSSGGTTITPFGIAEDKPVVGDYDGDGMDDIAIFRPSNAQWWLNRSTDGVVVYQFGAAGDQTVQGDYTGDGKTDVGFFRPTTGEWFVVRSDDDSFYSFPFGLTGDIPSPGDYDGDGEWDAAVFRPSTTTWFVNGSTSGVEIVGFGLAGDVPLPSVYSVP
jgi:uncharacterized delta-60 repeat protein